MDLGKTLHDREDCRNCWNFKTMVFRNFWHYHDWVKSQDWINKISHSTMGKHRKTIKDKGKLQIFFCRHQNRHKLPAMSQEAIIDWMRKHGCIRFAKVYRARRSTKYKNNTTGFPGVIPHRNKFRARIGRNNKILYLGAYDTVLEAALARLTAEDCLGLLTNESEIYLSIKAVWPEMQFKLPTE